MTDNHHLYDPEKCAGCRRIRELAASDLLAELEAGVEGLVARDAALPFRDIHGQPVTYSTPHMIVSKRAVLDLIRKVPHTCAYCGGLHYAPVPPPTSSAAPPSDPAAPPRCDFDCDACRDVDDGWQERGNPFEAEARAALLAELRRGVEGLPTGHVCQQQRPPEEWAASDCTCERGIASEAMRAAVLDLIRKAGER